MPQKTLFWLGYGIPVKIDIKFVFEFDIVRFADILQKNDRTGMMDI